MAIFSHAPVSRYVDGISALLIKADARIIVSGFLQMIGARTVHFASGPSAILVDLVEKETGRPFFRDASPEARENMQREVLSAEAAATVCAAKLWEFPQLPNISGGVSFGINEPPRGPKNTWRLVLHRGPLPLLSVEISDVSGFKPTEGWEQVLIDGQSAHVVSSTKLQFGTQDHIYLLRKRSELFPFSKGPSSQQAVDAGRQLREICKRVATDSGLTGIQRVPMSGASVTGFLQGFDSLLRRAVGDDDLAHMLRLMGTTLDRWLNASRK